MTNQLTTGTADTRAAGQAIAAQMGNIFGTLKSFYTQYYLVIKNEKQELQMMRQWAAELLRAKISEDMLRKGVSRAKTHASEDSFCKWPSVVDFIYWCYELPDPEDAYRETVANYHDMLQWEPSHPAVALVFELVNRTNMRKMDERAARAEYIRAYGKVRARVLAGEVLKYTKPEPVKHIAYQQTEAIREDGAASLQELKRELAAGEQKPKKERGEFEQKKAAAIAKALAYMESKGGEA